MEYMFRQCSSLTSLDITNFDTRQVTSMNYMFYQSTKITSLDLSNFNTEKCNSFTSMFYSCRNLTISINKEHCQNLIDKAPPYVIVNIIDE